MKNIIDLLDNPIALNFELNNYIQRCYSESSKHSTELISITDFHTQELFFRYYPFYCPSLAEFDKNEEPIDQLCQDIFLITRCARLMVFQELEFFSKDLIKELPTNEVIEWKQRSFSGKMRFVEEKLGELFTLTAVLLNITNVQPNLENKIEKLHMNLSHYILRVSDIILNKYIGLFSDSFKDSSIILNDDGCYTPCCFDECEGVNQGVSAFEIYRASLIVYGNSKTPITISFRDEAFGKGAFFDHYNLQQITGRKTEISLASGLDLSCFDNEIGNNSLPLKGDVIYKNKKLPAISNNDPNAMGLLVIPGYSRTTPEKRYPIHKLRIKHEVDMIKQAQKYDQPLLAICGGLWTLLQAIGGTTKEVKNHTGTMPSLLEDGNIDLGERPNVHPLYIKANSKLAHLMGYPLPNQYQNTKALSVHWQATDTIPNNFQASAFSEDKVIEAIESLEPNQTIIGIQGHPEAMRTTHKGLEESSELHHNLICNLALKGDEYHQQIIDKKQEQIKEVSYSELFNLFGVNKGKQPNLMVKKTDNENSIIKMAC